MQSYLNAPPPPSPPASIADTTYQTRVQYAVNYFQKSEKGGLDLKFVLRNTYDEPVEFEVTGAHDKLPALEETKDVISPHDQTAGSREVGGKRPRLGQLDRIGETTLKVQSPFLLNVLKSVIEYSAESPGWDWHGPNVGRYFTPYKDLYYHLPDLERYKAEDSPLRQKHSPEFNKLCDEHIDLLKSYLESQPNIPLVEARTQWANKTPVTTFAAFWLLLKPGTDVYVRETDGSLNAYVAHGVTGGITMENGKRTIMPYQIEVWNLVFGGSNIFRRIRTIQVPVFDNEREIVEMPLFPVKFVDDEDGDETRQKLIARGKKYFAYSRGACFLEYSGLGSRDGAKSVR
jgi:hypothetical protein